MLLDVRTYRVKPGQLKTQFELYEKYGKPAQTKHLGQPLAFLRTETGDPNEYVHIWVYENAADREKKRAAMMADPGWQDYLKRSAELGALVSQTNKLMLPV
ncbi:MAG: NIPSNAP family protein, partial [Bacteroidota bacterium]|nr:NIPSNAP family protein [Kiloniellaceae bacterium]